MHWLIKHSLETNLSPQAISVLLQKDRGLSDPADPLNLTPADAGLDSHTLAQAIDRIKLAITHHSSIIIYGDYDADGITATAILWETLHALGAKAYPFIPSRELHGYGLSLKGISAALSQYHALNRLGDHALIITVDNGITAFAAAEHLQERGIDLIITDHHQKGEKPPPHYALVHTDKVSGAGVAWFLAKSLVEEHSGSAHKSSPEVALDDSSGEDSIKSLPASTLDLVTIGTVADMLPLTGVNRSLVKAGLVALEHSERPGIQALFASAGIDKNTELSTYHINYILAPRLNAMGRLEHAIDSLRLLCTKNAARAKALATRLHETNVTRQDLTQTLLDQALGLVKDPTLPILVIDHPDFHEGVIGLVAGKLAETYYRPTIIISRHEEVSKASARSVAGVNIIELIRTHEDLLINAGGHPMAAGFTLKTDAIEAFRMAIQVTASAQIDPALLEPRLTIDCALSSTYINQSLFKAINQLKPFGVGNPEPVFCLSDCRVIESRLVGKNQNHLKLTLQTPTGNLLPAIGFGLAKFSPEVAPDDSSGVNCHKVSPGVDKMSFAFTLSENTWKDKTNLQLIIKDIKSS